MPLDIVRICHLEHARPKQRDAGEFLIIVTRVFQATALNIPLLLSLLGRTNKRMAGPPVDMINREKRGFSCLCGSDDQRQLPAGAGEPLRFSKQADCRYLAFGSPGPAQASTNCPSRG